MPLRLQPDALLIAAAYLRQHAEVAARAAGVHANRLPSPTVWPCLRVQRVIDTDIVAGHFAAARLQVDAFAAELRQDREAWLLASTAKAALLAMPGWQHPEGAVAAVEEVAGLQPLPDADLGRARYVFDVRVFVHPHRV